MSIALIVTALVAAVFIAPIGSEEGPATPDPAPTIGPSQLRPSDERLLEAGRRALSVGRPTPEISFLTFDGVEVELHQRTRPVVVVFLGDTCVECDAEMSKLAVIGAISSQDAWVAALAGPGARGVAENAYVTAGAADLIYAGVDEDGAIVRSFGIRRTPATVVLNAQMRITAVWQRSVSAAVVTELVRRLLTTG